MFETALSEKRDRYIKNGFSLIEIMIVLAILGLIIYILAPRFTGMLDKARIKSTKIMLHTIKNAIIMYKTDTGEHPERLRDLIKKPSEERAAKKWEGPYFDEKEVPTDPWGNTYKYERTQSGYELYSYGPHGKGAPKDEYIRAE